MNEQIESDSVASFNWGSSVETLGWYFYGVARNDRLVEEAIADAEGIGGQLVEMVPCNELVAIVSLVSLSKFETDTLRSRLRDASYLEVLVRNHEAVIQAVQRKGTILPARFGLVFSTGQELVVTMEELHDAFLAELKRFEGCDEWGVKLYADRQVFRRRVAAETQALQELKQELVAAKPGRAYFLELKLAGVLDSAIEQTLSELAQAAYDYLACHAAAAAELNHPSSNEAAILRAAFLVPRESLPSFVAAIDRLAMREEGLRCEYNGPWAPYSFTMLDEVGLR